MLKAVLVSITALLMAVLVPGQLLTPVQKPQEEEYLLIVRDDNEVSQEPVSIGLKTKNGVEEMLLEDYLVGVVLSEMPASFEIEALKAQAVAARTFAMRQMAGGKHNDCDLCSSSSCCQAWTSQKDIEAKLGSSFLSYWTKAEEAVKATDRQVIYYGDKLIDAVYFSCSGGKTEDAVAVWGGDVPYLQSVESPGEEQARVYTSTVTVTPDEFADKLKKENSAVQLAGSPAGWFGSVERTEGDGVAAMQIGGVKFSGTKLRELFGLKSTNFNVSVTESGVEFSVYGYGHRVGMSQYGANAMAKSGKTYQDILEYYYTGVNIEKHP